ncbi:choice-of-anchor P family protein [Streptomyces sp. SL13]|uniref:Choice-of-anchor P family protein n=1 Tax=Streptantibioticus silvisoli TaxID=2705255 RepID=A0AA90HAK6_9ACTN|nr:choice-of-anchor P family protein [Streptantibioticus silvisoli]MDI5973279.1 choice-of-anchor P family protein [Streptantibioticus silvisoli]
MHQPGRRIPHRIRRRTPRRLTTAVALAAALAAAPLAAAGPAIAATGVPAAAASATTPANAPGHPGNPAPPVPVFTEDFEHGQGAAPSTLTGYTGAPPVAETYTADPAWLSGCNGYLVSGGTTATDPPGSGCGPTAWAEVKKLAGALGTWAGSDPATNHAVTAYTQGDPGAGKVQLQTVGPIPLTDTGRFLTFSVDVAAENCFAAHPLLSFFLLDGDRALPTSTAPIDACAHPQSTVGGIGVGTYSSNGSVLFDGSSAGIRLVNDQASGDGNDGAFDNVRLLDATPQLDVGLSPSSVPVGAPATLTFTVTNTDELAAKDGWSFTAQLPAGLSLADGSTTDCGGGTLTAGPGGALAVSGDLAAGQASCVVTAHVTSLTPGSYQVCGANITDRVGLDAPGCAAVTFTAPLFDARANAADVVSPLAGVGPLVPSSHSCVIAPGTDSHSLLTASLGVLGSLGALSSDASGTVAADGTRTAAAHASIANVSLLGGLITADALTTQASAAVAVTANGPGDVTLAGDATFTGLRIAGVTLPVHPAPNTTIALPLVGSVVLNEHVTLSGGRGITVNALHVTLLTGVHLTLSTSTAALPTGPATCPAV